LPRLCMSGIIIIEKFLEFFGGIMTLDILPIGDKATVKTVGGEGALRRRLLDMGLTPGTGVMVRKVAPLGDPIEICLRGYELTLRREDARLIEVGEVSE